MSRHINLAGTNLTIDDNQPTFWDRVEAGTWEPQTLARLASLCGPGTTLVDIGAWVGPTALYAAALGADVVAIEADPAALEQLQRNLAANPDLAPRIRVIDRAISADRTPVAFGARRKPGDSMSSVLLAEKSDAVWTTPAITPDELFGDMASAGDIVVKLDIEGGEFALLPALVPALPPQARAMVVSFHPALLLQAMAGDESGFRAAVAAAGAPLSGWDTGHVDLAAAPLGMAPEDAILAAKTRESVDLFFVRR